MESCMSFLCAFVLSAPLLMFTILHFQFYILHLIQGYMINQDSIFFRADSRNLQKFILGPERTMLISSLYDFFCQRWADARKGD